MKKNILFALLSSLILWLAWPPHFGTAPLLLIGFFPLLAALEGIYLTNDARKIRKVWLLSGLTFIIWNTLSIYWIWNASPAGAIVAYLLGAFLMTLSFYLYFKVKTIAKPWIADISLIGFWVFYEYLHQTWDLNFPWMTLGNGFASFPQLVQWYEYTGVYGGTVWILACNLLLLNIYRELHKTQRIYKNIYKLSFGFLGAIIIPITISLIIYTNYEEESNPSHVIVVQPNIDPYQKYSYSSTEQQLEKLFSLSKEALKPNTEFVIWPETAIPDYIDEDRIREGWIFDSIQHFLKPYPNTTLITGAETTLTYLTEKTSSAKHDKRNNIYWDSFNTAIAIENSSKVQFHHKSKLVPGVEKTPFSSALAFMKPVFAKFGGTTGQYGEQEEPTVLYARSGIGVAPVICYESIWGNWVTKYVKNEAQFIAIITNDGWWGNTSGKDQHLQYASLRAIETRRWIARSANTGISAFINQKGDLVQKTSWWEEAVIQQDINLNSELTFYVKHPDLIVFPFLGIGILAFFYMLINNFRNKKRNL
jgi:apolipoprotein N-acyltransferase